MNHRSHPILSCILHPILRLILHYLFQADVVWGCVLHRWKELEAEEDQIKRDNELLKGALEKKRGLHNNTVFYYENLETDIAKLKEEAEEVRSHEKIYLEHCETVHKNNEKLKLNNLTLLHQNHDLAKKKEKIFQTCVSLSKAFNEYKALGPP